MLSSTNLVKISIIMYHAWIQTMVLNQNEEMVALKRESKRFPRCSEVCLSLIIMNHAHSH